MSDQEAEAMVELNSRLAQEAIETFVEKVQAEGGDLAGALLQLSLTGTGTGFQYVRNERGMAEADRWWNIFCTSMANSLRGKQRFLFQTEPIPDDPADTPSEA